MAPQIHKHAAMPTEPPSLPVSRGRLARASDGELVEVLLHGASPAVHPSGFGDPRDPGPRCTQWFFFTKNFVLFSKMYKIFGCRVVDFPGFLEKIPSFGVKSADVSENLKIFEVFYKNVQNFEKQ